jgi:protein-L-isoaspartate(D-aspartate) O-methyltransferase
LQLTISRSRFSLPNFLNAAIAAALILQCAPSLSERRKAPATGEAAIADSAEQRRSRAEMVREQMAARGIRDRRVLEAMRTVPRHLFVPPSMVPYAYQDTPLPIGYGQTISQPYIVAFMTEALELRPRDRVLEIGTGSGYQAAVLARLCREVYSIEIVAPLGKQAAERLQRLGHADVRVRIGDGYAGWPEAAPFDAVIVTAAPERIPETLIEQLRVGGTMVVPVGVGVQSLVRLRKTPQGLKREMLLPVRFVPMVKGEAAVQQPR